MTNSWRLSVKEKWQLVGSLMLIYFPIFLYVAFPVYSPGLQYTVAIFNYQLITAIVVTGMLYVWISFSEWVLIKLMNQFGEEFIAELRMVSLVPLLILGCALAIAFIVVSNQVLMMAEYIFKLVTGSELIVRKVFGSDQAFFDLYKRVNVSLFLLLMLSGFYQIAHRRANVKVRESALKVERLEKENAKTQLAALRNQVSPHFLFNSLSILKSLVSENPQLSARFIDELSSTYRYILQQSKSNRVSLSEELAFIRSYTYLLSIRFEKKFDVEIRIDDATANQYLIAPMTLQLLVENAVRHNQMSDQRPLKIEIFADHDYLVISNNLQLRTSAIDSTGLGLLNIIDRYRLINAAPVSIHSKENIFEVRIPLLKADEPYESVDIGG